MNLAFRAARHASGMTAMELGDKTGILETRIYSIERGRSRATPAEAVRLAVALNRTIAELFPARPAKAGAK